MMLAFHFIRPWWLLALIPLLGLLWRLLRQRPLMQAWEEVCDAHLLKALVQSKSNSKRMNALSWLFLSATMMIVGLAGPTWTRLPTPTYREIQPRVLILDMSDSMLEKDLSPDRLTRAKFKLHDLFQQKNMGQLALIAYTDESFVVSPLTDDAKTIDTLLPSLTQDIMPVQGQRLASALEEAQILLKQADYDYGQVLVLAAGVPSNEDIQIAKNLAAQGLHISVIPLMKEATRYPLFQRLATAGKGELIPYTDTSKDVQSWLKLHERHQQYQNQQNDVPTWKDEGSWFLFPALFLLLPVFRKGWLQRVAL